MAVYKLETPSRESSPDGTPLYDVTRDGEPLVSGVTYLEAFAAALAVVDNDDRWREVCDGRQYCDIGGAVVKAQEAARNAFFHSRT